MDDVYLPPHRPWAVYLDTLGAHAVLSDPHYCQALARRFRQSSDFIVEAALRILVCGHSVMLTIYW